ncbi:MAG: hypothetical protein ACI8XM_000327 [Haloarculaceae archaeon]|jgi:hypothetical protein
MSENRASDGGKATQRQQNKVERLIHKYGLDGFGAELEQMWTGETGDQYSVRDLAEQFNKKLLSKAIEREEMRPLQGEVDNLYRLLTESDVSGGDRTEAYTRLEQSGVNIDDLEDDFVSHQSVYRYLTKHRGVEHTEDDHENAVESGEQTIQRLRKRTEIITESTIERFANGEYLDIEEFDVLVDVQVICHSCGKSYDVTELLSNGGCDCT